MTRVQRARQGRSGRRPGLLLAALVAVLAPVNLTGSGSRAAELGAASSAIGSAADGQRSAARAAAPASRGAVRAAVPEARTGRPAASSRIRFEPERLVLRGAPGRSGSAVVVPARTVGDELQVPDDVRHLGWWDGSSDAGDPFGSTVIAGHVDSASQGLGFFARLLRTRPDDQVILSGAGHSARYRVVSVRTVAKDALSSDSRAFRQDGAHRLVLITCAGAYRPEWGGYDSNLVVTAEPVGLAR